MMKKTGIAMAIILASSNVAMADQEKSFTMFTLGMESVQYNENTNSGITSSGNNMINLTQQSTSYTAVSDDFGFYITTVSTLSASENSESWSINNSGIVQTNQRQVSLTDLHLQGSWSLDNGIQLLGGLSLNRLNFSRSGFALTANAPATLKAPQGAVFEYSTTLLAEIGVEYDSFFNHENGLRLIGEIRTGIPLYYYVTNSNFPNVSWTSSFKGYNIHADIGVGYQIVDNFDFIMSVTGDYRFRPATTKKAVKGGYGYVPNTALSIVRLTSGLAWSF